MKRIIRVESISDYLQFVNQFTNIANEYFNAMNNHESAVVDFCHNTHIDATCSQNLFGRLLIVKKIPNVLCKNLNLQRNVIKTIFDGIMKAYEETYPQGLKYNGVSLVQPQIEMYDPSGDQVYCLIKLSDEFYAALKS